MFSPAPRDPLQRYIDRLAPLVDHVRENLRGDLSVEALAQVVHFSPYHFHRLFTAVMGETVGTFVRRVRLERAAQLMKAAPRRSLSAVAHEAGFGSLSDFSRAFRRQYGLAPSRWDRRSRLNCRASPASRDPADVASRDPADVPSRDPAKVPPYDPRSGNVADERPLSAPQLRETPPLRLAYVRIRRPFEAGALARGYERLREWLHGRRLPEDRLLGLSWDDVDVTPLDQIRYDFAATVPAGARGGKGVGIRDLPGLLIVASPATGSLDRVARVWDHLYHDWLPRSRFEPYNLPPFEWYRAWPDAVDTEDWDLDCCIPLKPLDES